MFLLLKPILMILKFAGHGLNHKIMNFIRCQNVSKRAEKCFCIFGRMRQLKIQKHFSDRKSTRLNSSHVAISYAVFCLKKKKERKKKQFERKFHNLNYIK